MDKTILNATHYVVSRGEILLTAHNTTQVQEPKLSTTTPVCLFRSNCRPGEGRQFPCDGAWGHGGHFAKSEGGIEGSLTHTIHHSTVPEPQPLCYIHQLSHSCHAFSWVRKCVGRESGTGNTHKQCRQSACPKRRGGKEVQKAAAVGR